MIRTLTLKHFRSHDDSTITFEPLTVLIGPAGGGKSNVFAALRLLRDSTQYPPNELFPPGLTEFRWVRSLWAESTSGITLNVELEGLPKLPEHRAEYSITFADGPDGVYIHAESLHIRPVSSDEPSRTIFVRSLKSRPVNEFGFFEASDLSVLAKTRHQRETLPNSLAVRIAHAVSENLAVLGYYHLEPDRIKRASGSSGDGQNIWRIGYFGENVAGFLEYLRLDPDRARVFESITGEMRELLPHLETIETYPLGEDRSGFAFRFRGQDGRIAAPDLSDGILLTLALLCLVYQPAKPPRILCLEEPENGLHPKRLRWLVDHLSRLTSEHAGRTQVVLSTHSPYLLDLFRDAPEAVQVVSLLDNGRSQVRPLSKIFANLPEERRKELKDISLGDQWYVGLFDE